MDVQIKQEPLTDDGHICNDVIVKNELTIDDTAEDDYLFPECDVIVKKEELMIDDAGEDSGHNPEYQIEGYSIQFLDDENGHGKNEDEYVVGFGDFEDDYMYDDDDSRQLKEMTNPFEDPLDEEDKHSNRVRRLSKISFVHRKLEKMLSHNRVCILCPVCYIKLKSLSFWSRHITVNHVEFSEDLKKNYDYSSLHKAQCKYCYEKFPFHANHFLHYLTTHCPRKRKIFHCNMCKHYQDSSIEVMAKHVKDNHSKPINDSENCCPITDCGIMFPDVVFMQHHFKQAHFMEYKSKFECFSCHLCNHPKFGKEIQYYDHLMNLHGLCDYNWEKLQFRQIIGDDDNHFECTQCPSVCVVQTGLSHTLLEHFLTHEDNAFWWCRFCHGKFSFKDSIHMCKGMHKSFLLNELPNLDLSLTPSQASTSSSCSFASKKIVNDSYEDWQAFEAYVMHICPFCGQKFTTFNDWKLHLRIEHYIHTLKGLGMAIHADPERFRCRECHELVEKTSRDLHIHRFQHLPHKPYECTRCFQVFKDVKSAFAHYLSQCGRDANANLKDIEKMCFSKQLRDDESNWIEIFCAICKHLPISNEEHIQCHFQIFHNNFEKNYAKNPNNIDMVCGLCKTTIRSVSSEICLSHYINHMEGPYRCLYCQRTYKEMDICRRHIRRFHMIGPRMKRSQFALFRKKKTIIQPEAKPTVARVDSPAGENSSNNTSQENIGLCTLSAKANVLNEFENFITYACAECNQNFDKNSTAWSEHIKTQHTFFNDNEVSEMVDGKLKCKHCDLILDKSISQRQKHKLTHMPYKSFVCSICDTGTTTLGLLYGHFRRIHFRKGTFECPICLVVLTTAYERANHVNKTHPRSEWPKKMCLICYRNYGSLSAHMLTHDVNRPKHSCPECGVEIISLTDLRKHIEKKHDMRDEKFKTIFSRVEHDDKRSSPTEDPLLIVQKEEPMSNKKASKRQKLSKN